MRKREKEREREGDETRATFAPVHRPQPPQIVKSCLQLSEILIFPDESFPRFLPSPSLFFSFSSSEKKRSKAALFLDYITLSFVKLAKFSFLLPQTSKLTITGIHANFKLYLLLPLFSPRKDTENREKRISRVLFSSTRPNFLLFSG